MRFALGLLALPLITAVPMGSAIPRGVAPGTEAVQARTFGNALPDSAAGLTVLTGDIFNTMTGSVLGAILHLPAVSDYLIFL
jgi:hypothetical protein